MSKRARFARYVNPILECLAALGGSARPREVYGWIAERLDITDKQRAVQNKSGVSQFENDVAWSRFFLVRAGYLDSSRWGVWSLTEKGRHAGSLPDSAIDEMLRAVRAASAAKPAMPAETAAKQDPTIDTEEYVAPAEGAPVSVHAPDHRELVLGLMRGIPPSGFERLCQRILREAGFQNVRVTGRSGDGGIDGVGVLQVNPLLTFKVLFQSKRYQGAVTAGQVRDFRGAMQGRADKGLIITTGAFTADAQAEAVRDGVPPIELVDGAALVTLMEQLELGLTPRRAFDVDRQFFAEFDDL